MLNKKINYIFIGISVILIFIASFFSTVSPIYIIAQIINFLGVVLLIFGLISLMQEKDKEIFNKIESHTLIRSILIIILCFFVIILNFLKVSPVIVLGFFSITVMLFLFTKLLYGKDKENKQLEIYIDTKSIITGIQISLIFIFVTFYGYTFYNLWISSTTPDPIIFMFIYVIIFFLLLVETLKVIFIKIYQ